MRALALCLALVLAAAPQAAGGDNAVAPDSAHTITGYVSSPGYRNYIATVVNLLEVPPLKAECPSLVVTESDEVVVIKAPTFVKAGAVWNIDGGTWIAKVHVDRCGKPAIRRFLLEAIPGADQVKPIRLFPGEFAGNLQLEADASRILLPGVMGVAKCNDWKTLYILDTKLTNPVSSAGWSERWLAQACDRRVSFDVDYARAMGGVNITGMNFKAL